MRSLLERFAAGGVTFWSDSALFERSGIRLALTERTGGVSAGGYSSLNLALHVGDDPSAVEENRRRLLAALGIEGLRDRLTCAGQVHGVRVALVSEADAGAGAHAPDTGPPPLPGVDALVTSTPDIPLMLHFADCVPVVLVAERPRRAVAVVHAGWRGAADGVHQEAAKALATHVGCDISELRAYVGPHIGPCHYPVGEEVLSRFYGADTIAAARGHLDLGAVVSAGLEEVGVGHDRQVALELCTAENTHRFYSYRAEGVTGRHAALVAILRGEK